MARTFAEIIKTAGNLNRMAELDDAGCSAIEMQACFALAGITLVVQQGDFPLLKNLPELGRKALPKSIERRFLRERDDGLPA